MREDFAIFILSHGRPNNLLTHKTLERCGNTNKVYYIIDNEDKYADRYYWNFGEENVIMFNKKEAAESSDTMDLIDSRNIVLFARNMCHKIASDLGIKYFLELDDDYTTFRSRMFDGKKLNTVYVRDFDAVCDAMIEFLDVTGATTVAFSQTGDFIGGTGSKVYKERLTRKAMNAFFCRTDKPFKFTGRINEDVNAYVTLGSRGELFFTVADIALNQQDTQQNEGGLTDAYLNLGTYVKSFYTVMGNPSSVKIGDMGVNHKRLHHLILWDNAVPKIISSRYKK